MMTEGVDHVAISTGEIYSFLTLKHDRKAYTLTVLPEIDVFKRLE